MAPVAGLGAQQSPGPASIKTLSDLVQAVEAKENAVKTVQIEMRTKGKFPGGPEFETTGTLRVLGKTHFHSRMTMRVGDAGRPQMQSESETVTTPDGVTMRENDPMQGEVFVRMSRELLRDLESASKALGETGSSVAPGDGMANGPLGSVMLRDLQEVFALELSGPAVVGKHECYIVRGPRRDDVEIDSDVLGGADRVELLVRRADLAVVRMTQFEAGRPTTEVEIQRLILDEPLEPSSFEMPIPVGVTVLDAMDHPSHRAQIQRLFADAKEAGWKRGEDAGAADPKTDDDASVEDGNDDKK